MKDAIQITAKMYDCQKAAKGLWKEEYEGKVMWYKKCLQAISEKEKIDILQSVLFACEDNAVQSNGIAVMMFMAAAVEIIEPTDKHKVA